MDNKQVRYDCLSLAAKLTKINDDGARVDLTFTEVVEAAKIFYKFVTEENESIKNG